MQSQQQLLDTYIKNSINSVDDDVAQAASQSLSSEFARAVKAWGDADTCATKAKASEHDPHWNQPVIPDAETKRQEAINDAKAARDAANQAVTRANRLRQKADALAQEAYEIEEVMNTKEGSERAAEMERLRDKSVELPSVLQDLKRAEQDANLALVRANDAGISPQDLQQREQSPWGDILPSSEATSETPEGPNAFATIRMPRRMVGRRALGTIICALPHGQLVVTVPHESPGTHFKAYILPKTYSMERKEFKRYGGQQLDYVEVDSYNDDNVPRLLELDPVLVAVQTGKDSGRNILVILIATRRGSDGSFLIFNLSRLKALYPASKVNQYLNDVRLKQDQDPICPITRKTKAENDEERELKKWKAINNIP